MTKTSKLLVLLALVATALVPTRPAAGAFPGFSGLIAFTATGSGSADICVIGPGGEFPVRVVDGAGDQTEPAWSPDGMKLAYVDSSEGSGEIKVLDLAAGITTTLGPGFRPAWSPDGTKIVFMDGGIFVMDADDGSNRTQIVEGGLRPVWSPDGTTIAFDDDLRNGVVDEGGIFLVDADGSNEREISGGEYPDWSPDGTRLVANNGFWAGALFTMNADGTEQETLIEGHAAEGPVFYDPVWSPEGDRIAFTRIELSQTGSAQSDIWTIASDGTDARPLIATSAQESEPDWQPVSSGAPPIPGETPCTTTPADRAVTLRLRGHLVARGRVTSTYNACRQRRVAVERKRRNGVIRGVWERVATVVPDPAGSFSVRLPDRPGRYRSRVRGTPDCAPDLSGIRVHRH